MAAEREAHARRARALADLGQRALSARRLADVMEDACGLAAAAMDLAQVHVQLFDAEEGSLRMAAAVGTGASSLPRSEPLEARPMDRGRRRPAPTGGRRALRPHHR